MNRYLCSLYICVVVLFSHSVQATPEDRIGGTMTANLDGKVMHFPTLKTDIDADIQGDIATVTVVQTFANPSLEPLHATYLFPLNKDAAVYAMTMEVGDEIVQAVIKEKEEAQKTFNTAKRQGKAAALLEQHRPNMFTQKLANLMPGLPVKVTLKYVQTVPRVDDAYELVVPLVVGPRYQPVGAGQAPDSHSDRQKENLPEVPERGKKRRTQFGAWELEALPEYPHVGGITIPDTIDPERVSIKVNLQAGQKIQTVHSRTHSLSVDGKMQQKQITLADGRTIDNRDFVLRYQLGGTLTEAGFLSSYKEGQGYFSLLLEPPAAPKDAQITPREMVFVLDTSGSMHGEPLQASKRFMEQAVRQMRPTDYFRIIRFSNNASEFTAQPVRATPENIRNGLSYIRSLQADGGTEAMSAIHQAFGKREVEGTLRIVVFLTDGYIGNEHSVLKAISENLGAARIYAFGVGTGVNRYLLSEMGRHGKGFARFMDPTEKSEEVAVELARKLNAPVLTDISLDWGELDVSEITPSVIPDLFAGDSIRIQGKFEASGAHTVKIAGKIQGHAASLPLQVMVQDNTGQSGGEAIPLIWARSQIADAMRAMNTPVHMRGMEIDNSDLKQRVTDLGLAHSLVTRWTSFVAVSKKIVNEHPAVAKESQVPLHKVKGVTQKAYGSKGMQGNSMMHQMVQFSGNSVPEPATTGGLVVLGGAGLAALRRRRKARKDG